MRVVLVEDDEDTRELMCYVLAAEGARFRCVATGQEALQAIAREPPDVLLTDISMPGMDGYMLLRRIRQLTPEQGGTMPAAAISAHASDESRASSLEAGFDLHVTKPVVPEDLVETVLKLAQAGRP